MKAAEIKALSAEQRTAKLAELPAGYQSAR